MYLLRRGSCHHIQIKCKEWISVNILLCSLLANPSCPFKSLAVIYLVVISSFDESPDSLSSEDTTCMSLTPVWIFL